MTEPQSELSNNRCHVKTIFKTKTYTFDWTVENFSKFPLGTEKESPSFYPFHMRRFHATLGIENGFQAHLMFHHIPVTYENNIEVRHNVSIKNKAGTVVLECNKIHIYDKSSSTADVLPECTTIIDEALNENVLILKCVMEINEKHQTDMYCYKPHPKPVFLSRNLLPLSKDLQAMYDTSAYTDVSLKVDDSTVRVHKFILCARSSVFARMFETPMGETEENVINITDLDLPILKDLVLYLYTNLLTKNDFESVYDLYYAADKYDVSSLRKKCSDVLLSKLDVENACRVLALSDRHSDNVLKDSVVRFITFNFEKVQETDVWKELVENTPRLAVEVFSDWSKYLIKNGTT